MPLPGSNRGHPGRSLVDTIWNELV